MFDEKIIQTVWEGARAFPEQDSTQWRQDPCGAWIRRDHYQSANSEFGWHIENVSPGGEDIPENLRAYHVKNHFDHGNGTAHCVVKADPDTIANQPS